MAFCAACGAEAPDGVKFCTVCGVPMARQASVTPANAASAPVIDIQPPQVPHPVPDIPSPPQPVGHTDEIRAANAAVPERAEPVSTPHAAAAPVFPEAPAKTAPTLSAPPPRFDPLFQEPPPPPYQAAQQRPLYRPAEIPPPKGSPYTVTSTLGYIGLMILFFIPVIGWIACIIMAFTAKNRGRRNYARAALILAIIGIILTVATYFVFGWIWQTILGYAQDSISNASIGTFPGFNTFSNFFGSLH